jgi:hypothetical protein
MRKRLLRVAVALTSAFGLIAGAGAARQSSPAAATTSCALGNGVQHVIEITFDNVHFFRDNRTCRTSS